jgi:hypothetical protein
LDSDEDFMLYRRFGYVQARLLVERQEDLRKLEAQLDSFDKEMAAKKNESILRSRDERSSDRDVQRRRALIDALQKKFCEYCECWLLS